MKGRKHFNTNGSPEYKGENGSHVKNSRIDTIKDAEGADDRFNKGGKVKQRRKAGGKVHGEKHHERLDKKGRKSKHEKEHRKEGGRIPNESGNGGSLEKDKSPETEASKMKMRAGWKENSIDRDDD